MRYVTVSKVGADAIMNYNSTVVFINYAYMCDIYNNKEYYERYLSSWFERIAEFTRLSHD